MPRIYLPFVSIANDQISITGDKARYLTSVLRCVKGDELIIFDGEGSCFRSVIMKSGKREVVVDVLEKFSSDLESPLDIVLVQGVLKGEKMDLVIQKTTELGVKGIIPVITARSQVRETRKIARWKRIAEEASRQSGRSAAPVVHEVETFGDLFSDHSMQTLAEGIIFYEEGGMKLSEAIQRMKVHCASDSISSLLVVVGPEGGFTKEEVKTAEERGFFTASLGRRVLRAETAAISAVALVQFSFGDMG